MDEHDETERAEKSAVDEVFAELRQASQGDDADPELTPRRLVCEVLAEVASLRAPPCDQRGGRCACAG